jgi:hypothetical protein
LAQVTIKLEKTNETVAGIDLKFPWFSSKGEFSRERTEVNGETVDIIYNISQVNAQKNCSKHNKFEIGVYNCLKGKLQLWKDAGAQTTGGGASCSSSVNVKRVASGNLGVKVWTIDLGPSASATEKGVYSFTVMVPPKP